MNSISNFPKAKKVDTVKFPKEARNQTQTAVEIMRKLSLNRLIELDVPIINVLTRHIGLFVFCDTRMKVSLDSFRPNR